MTIKTGNLYLNYIKAMIPKHTTQDGIQSSLSAPGLQSLDSAQMSN